MACFIYQEKYSLKRCQTQIVIQGTIWVDKSTCIVLKTFQISSRLNEKRVYFGDGDGGDPLRIHR